jgi:hypothetical protein
MADESSVAAVRAVRLVATLRVSQYDGDAPVAQRITSRDGIA